MFHIAWPWMVLVLPLPWLVARLLARAKAHRQALFFPFAVQVNDASSLALDTRHWFKHLLLILGWLSLVLAATRPQWLGKPEPLQSKNQQLILAVDISASMRTADMARGASRLQVVQYVGKQFIKQRQGDQVGLIIFATHPYVQTPITPDLSTVEHFLDQAYIGLAGEKTNIGDTIGLAIQQFAKNKTDKRGEPTSHLLILITDGASNTGIIKPHEAAEIAAKSNIKIHTIGVGAAAQMTIFGQQQNNALNEASLKNIAQTTGGLYFRATDVSGLQQIYQTIDALDPAVGKDRWARPVIEWYPWPLSLALLISIIAILPMLRRPT